jgi:outer membrane protein OmpA-like peptidoglycan-associated protein
MPSFVKHTLVAAVASALAGAAMAQSYVTAGSEPVRSAFGDHWRLSDRTPPPPKAVKYGTEVRFGFDDDVLSADARKELDALAQKLLAIEVDRVVAVGHADGVGPSRYNKRLSARRAKAVGDYLAGKGVAAERLQLVAMGQEGPRPDRRVEVELVGREK